jgi:hypothetical protein
MSPLPEKKKSPEEIQRLREALAGPHRPVPAVETPAPVAPQTHQEPPAAAVAPAPKPVHSLKKSERMPFKVVDDEAKPAPRGNVVPQPAEPVATSPIATAKASPQSATSGGAKIPARRHDERELSEMRRRGAIEMLHPRVNPRLLPASRWLLALGYLGPAIAAACIWLAEQPVEIGPGACALAFVSGTTIAVRRPVSRHHAAFMMAIATTVLICAAFHYFPHLLHAK